MKKILLLAIMPVVGAGVGGGAAFGVQRVLGPPPAHNGASVAEPTAFVPATHVLAPLVMADGRLAGYIAFDAELEVPAGKVATVTEQLPLLLNAINMRTYRAPLAAGPDGMLPDIAILRRVVMLAARETFPGGIIHRIAITRSEPA